MSRYRRNGHKNYHSRLGIINYKPSRGSTVQQRYTPPKAQRQLPEDGLVVTGKPNALGWTPVQEPPV